MKLEEVDVALRRRLLLVLLSDAAVHRRESLPGIGAPVIPLLFIVFVSLRK